MNQADIDKLSTWIPRSIRKHFAAFKGSYPMFFEGSDRVTEDGKSFTTLPAYFEFRVSGPSTRYGAKNYAVHSIFVNILITANNSQNIDLAHQLLQQIRPAFQLAVDVFKLGDGADGSKIGCVTIVSDGHEDVLVTDFGQLREDSTLRQLTVEAKYRMETYRDN